ncbi:uncharacterized protein LOC133187517 isoform X1 [Saccostrea echinata]|uniref:uncharacterized protein LOC133187517 isoform X1 n=1 Tax=Saccostrea echinata TaxID=191078 RepID=UPI002A80AA86|nr:uncharacterized protein LOC133187517 isoform X1 [Saccostrea echinata]
MEDSRELFIPFRKKTNKLNRSRRISAARNFLQSEIFKLNFQDIASSPKFRPLRHGFIDEDDFEDFKQDLLDFRVLKQELREGSSPECQRKARQATAEARRSRLSTDQLMEFFNSDENFQEFERVFETFKSKRFSNSADKLRLSLNRFEDDDSDSSDDDDKTIVLDDELFIGDIEDDPEEDMFTEFFDNDASFLEFEREFQTFKVKRRSRVIDRINRQSGCDIVSELQAICDRDPTKKYDAMLEAGEHRLWNSGGEWDYIFSHLNKNRSTSASNISGNYGSCSSLNTVHTYSECDTGFYSADPSNVNSIQNHVEWNSNVPSRSRSKSDISGCVQCCSEPSNVNNVPKCSCSEPCAQNSSHDCHFTSHQKCAQLVRLPCKHSPDGIPLDDSSQEVEGLPNVSDVNQSASNETTSEATNEKDETDSGYRSGTIPDDKLPRKPSQATLNREELKKKLEEYNSLVPGADFKLHTEKGETFQGFVKVTLNLVRPICMSLGARPPSVYELLTNEHIVEQNTQTISFYMPRDTVKSIHITSDETTKDVISMLLKKFHILDNPRKFALYEQELNEKGKIAKLRRIQETEYPLHVSLLWDSDRIERTRFVLQENENGEIDWEAFSLPELSNFLRVLDREEQEYLTELKHKYKFMKKIVQQRLKELRIEKQQAAGSKRDSYIRPAGADHPLAQSS